MNEKPPSIYFEDLGTNDVPLVLLHGYPLDHTIWLPIVEYLTPHARLIMPDLRGMGRSAVQPGMATMRAMAQDIVELLNRLDLEKVVLAGHSMGGYVALAFARTYPNRLSGLGLISTQSGADSTERRQARLQAADEVKRKGVKVVADAMAAKLTTHPELVDQIYALILRTHPKGVMAALKGMATREEASEWLAEISVPTVVITGSQDALIPAQKSHEMVQMLNRGWLVELPTAGHMPMMEEPRAVSEALLALLGQAHTN